MTIQQERDIAVAALEKLALYPQRREQERGADSMRVHARKALTDISTIAAQASPSSITLVKITDAEEAEMQAVYRQIEACEDAEEASPKAPSTLGQQVAQAQAEMATWTPVQRASVRLSGGDNAAQASPVAQDELMYHDAVALSLIERLGPTALTRGKIEPIKAFELGFESGSKWQTGRASVAVPAAPAMTDDDIKEEFNSKNECYEFPSEDIRRGALNQFAWGAWFGYRRAIASQPAAQPVGEAVAWMHDAAGRVDVIHDQVKKLWIKVGQPTGFYREKVPCKVEHYTIPLYRAAPPVAQDQDAALLPILREARGMVAYSASGYTHSGEMTNQAKRILARIDAAIAAHAKEAT